MQPKTIAGRVENVERRTAEACRRANRSRAEVTLIAVTKGFAPDAVREAVAAGIRHIGENRIQEAEEKAAALADLRRDLTWHMIGHLQTNKVKTALTLFDTIHSVDSLHLAEEISRRALESVPVFLEVNVAEEHSKFGFSLDELPGAYHQIAERHTLSVRGLMTIAPWTANPQEARPVFRRLAEAARDLQLPGLSMGMTDDFEVAIEEGATHVRVGRAIFGERA